MNYEQKSPGAYVLDYPSPDKLVATQTISSLAILGCLPGKADEKPLTKQWQTFRDWKQYVEHMGQPALDFVMFVDWDNEKLTFEAIKAKFEKRIEFEKVLLPSAPGAPVAPAAPDAIGGGGVKKTIPLPAGFDVRNHSTKGIVQACLSPNEPSSLLAGDKLALLRKLALTAWSVKGFFDNGGEEVTVFNAKSASEGVALIESASTISPGLVCCPLDPANDTWDALRNFAGRRDDGSKWEPFCFALLDTPKEFSAQDLDARGVAKLPLQGPDQTYHSAAVYGPWLCCRLSKDSDEVSVPASAFVAGAIAATDNRYGPYHAPAGTSVAIRSVAGLAHHVPASDAGAFNAKGINLIRVFPGTAEPVVFGTRTLSKDIMYRQVPVVRTLLSIRKALKARLQDFVFLPNSEGTRKTVTRMIYGYLEGRRRAGWFDGESAEQAFRITCDASNNKPDDVAAGILHVDVAVRPVRAAEFIEVKVTQVLEVA